MGVNFRNLKYGSNETLKIDKKLPQVKVTKKNVQVFYDWWNSDIRFENSVPQVFTEGYLILDNCWEIKNPLDDEYRKFLSASAVEHGVSYRQIQNE